MSTKENLNTDMPWKPGTLVATTEQCHLYTGFVTLYLAGDEFRKEPLGLYEYINRPMMYLKCDTYFRLEYEFVRLYFLLKEQICVASFSKRNVEIVKLFFTKINK